MPRSPESRLPVCLPEMTSEDTASVRTDREFDKSLNDVQKLLSEKRIAEANAAIERLLASHPEHAEAWYTNAVVKRLLNRPADALRALDRLHEIAPGHSRGFQEKGFLRMAEKNLEESVVAFEKAVELNPALVASWKALIGLYGMAENDAGVATASRHVEHLSSMPQTLLNVLTLLNEGRLGKAELLCREFLLKQPKNVEAMRLLAKIGAELGIIDDAETLLSSALELAPEFRLARFDYVGVLLKRQKFSEAFDEARTLREEAPDDYNFQRLYANTCLNVGRHEEALRIYHDVLAVDPENPQILLMCGHAAKTIGRVDEAVDYYRRSFAAKPDYGDAFWSLANLKTYSLTDQELATATLSEASPDTSTNDRIHLCFALGKAHEDRRDYGTGFVFYERGNELKKQQLGYTPDMVTAEVDAQISACTADVVESKSGFGYPASDPIFIVGLPRAGSTLLEQILASHSQIDGTLELPNILHFVAELNGRRMVNEAAKYPGILAELDEKTIQQFGRTYIEDTRIHRSGAPYFTDKMPNNFRHIGFIKMILPNAKIIDARRSPMACCFSGFKQLFAEGQAYTYGLEEIGRYYRDYVRLMDHWDQVFPGEILRVQYEDVIDDLEAQVERMLAYCGLPMEPACLEYYRTPRLVLTPSSEQVRQPIYRQSVEQWRNFEEYLEPLKSALGIRN